MGFDFVGAKTEGFTDSDIGEFLGFDYVGAKAEGFTDADVGAFLDSPGFRMPSPAAEPGFFEKVGQRFEVGQAQTELGLLGYSQIIGAESPETENRVKELNRQLSEAGEITGSLPSQAIQGVAELAPIIIEGIRRGAERGLKLGLGAGAITALAGQVGPQVALPEEIITVPVAFASMFGVGLTSGVLENIGQIEAGLSFNELKNLVDDQGNKISPVIAKSVAAGVGVINGLIEVAQIKTLLNTIPGGRDLLRGAIRRVVTKAVSSGALKASALKAAQVFGATVTVETGQELLQETTNILAVEVARQINNDLEGSNIPPQTREEIVNRLIATAKQSALSFGALSLPGAVITGGKTFTDAKKIQSAEEALVAGRGEVLGEDQVSQSEALIASLPETPTEEIEAFAQTLPETDPLRQPISEELERRQAGTAQEKLEREGLATLALPPGPSAIIQLPSEPIQDIEQRQAAAEEFLIRGRKETRRREEELPVVQRQPVEPRILAQPEGIPTRPPALPPGQGFTTEGEPTGPAPVEPGKRPGDIRAARRAARGPQIRGKIPADLVEAFDIMKDQVAQGQVERSEPGEGIMAKGHIIGSTFPAWFRGKGYSKEGFNAVLRRAEAGEKLTDRQAELFQEFTEIAKDLKKTDPDLVAAEDTLDLQRRGFEPVAGETKVSDLNEGDKFIIGTEEFELKEFDDKGNAIIEDGRVIKVDIFDTIKIDGIKPGEISDAERTARGLEGRGERKGIERPGGERIRVRDNGKPKEAPGEEGAPVEPRVTQPGEEAVQLEEVAGVPEKTIATDTPEFKKFFKDSKVVDEKGEPLVVFHGTESAFSTFRLGTGIGTIGEDQVEGIYFTDSRAGAEFFSSNPDDPRFFKEAYLSIKNPFRAEGIKALKESLGVKNLSEVSEILKQRGHDGLIVEKGFHAMGGPWRAIVAFDPTQIKLAKPPVPSPETEVAPGEGVGVKEPKDIFGAEIPLQKDIFGAKVQPSEKPKRKRAEKKVTPEKREAQVDLFTRKPQNQIQPTLFGNVPKGREKPTFAAPSGIQGQRIASGSRTTGFIGASGLIVKNVGDAASALAHLRKAAQESLYTIAVDKDGLILEIHLHTKGTKGNAPAVPSEMAGNIFNVPGTVKVYSIHNHPSGRPTSSTSDLTIHRALSRTLALKDIELESLVIAGTSYAVTPETKVGIVSEEVTKIRPALRATRVPVKERFFATKSVDSPVLTTSEVAKERFKDEYGNREGMIFFDSGLRELGFMPMPVGKPIKQAAVEIIAASDKLNATGIVVNSSEASFKESNREEFFLNLRDATGGAIQIFDVIDLGKSLGDAGLIPTKAKRQTLALRELKSEELLDDVEAAKARIKNTLTSQRGSFSLQGTAGQATFNDLLTVGRDIYNQGSTSLADFSARLKTALGTAWEKIKHIARRLWDSVRAVIANERGELGDKVPKLNPLMQKYVDEFVSKEAKTKKAAKPITSNKELTPPEIRQRTRDNETGPIPDAMQAESQVDAFRRRFQDQFLPLKRAEEFVEETGEALGDESPYLLEELHTGKQQFKLEKFEDEMVSPLMDAIKKSNVSLEELEEYLYARHAPERNAYIATINKQFEDGGGSGMADAEAQTIIANFDSTGKGNTLRDLEKMVRGISSRQREIIRNTGLETPEIVDAWERYDRYIPLKGVTDEDTIDSTIGFGRGLGVRKSGTKRALGRQSKATDLLANLVAQTTQTIQQAEIAKIGQSFLSMVEANPNPEMWNVIKPGDKFPTKKAFVKGKVQNVPDPTWINKGNVFSVTRDGEVFYIDIKNKVLAGALNRLNQPQSNIVIQALGHLNRYLATINTLLNPEFVITNFERDIQTAMTNLAGERGLKAAKSTLKDVPAAMAGIRNALRGDGKSEMAGWYDRFKAAGGQVGFMDLQSVDKKAKEIQKLTTSKDGPLKTARRYTQILGSFIGDYNTIVENAVRLSSFKTAVESGMSEAQAASLAKNLTVNFNRKGEYGAAMNAMFLFFNAGIQGSTRIIRALGNKNVRKITYAMTATAIAMAEMNRLTGGEDDDGKDKWDKVNPYLKQTNYLLMREDGSLIKIKLPYGFNIFVALGNAISDSWHYLASGGVKGQAPSVAASFMMTAALDAFNPIGGSGSLLQTVSPTFLDPFVDVAINKNFMDAPISPENLQFGPKLPDSERYWSNVRPISKVVARGLNALTGGTRVEKGAVEFLDISPETLDHFWDFATGGAGRFYADTAGTGFALAQGRIPKTSKIPFARKVIQDQNEYFDLQDFRKNADRSVGYFNQIRGLSESERIGFRRRHPEFRLKSAAMSTQRRISKLRKRQRRAEKSKNDALSKSISKQIRQRAMAFNRRFNEIMVQKSKE